MKLGYSFVAGLVLCRVLVALPPTTQSTTTLAGLKKSKQHLSSLEVELEQVKDKETTERGRCLADLHKSLAVQKLDEAVKDKEKKLGLARISGNPQERLDASSAFNQARKVVKDAEAKAIASSQTLADYSKQSKILETSIEAARQQVSELETKVQSEAHYLETHKTLVAAQNQLRSIIEIASNDAKSLTGYEKYRCQAQAMVRSLALLDKSSQEIHDDDDYSAFLTTVVSLQKLFDQSLSEREAIYPSADAIRIAIKKYDEALSWRKLERKWSKNAEQSLKDNQPDIASAQLDSAQKFLNEDVVALNEGRRQNEIARRALLTQENTKPALPDAEIQH